MLIQKFGKNHVITEKFNDLGGLEVSEQGMRKILMWPFFKVELSFDLAEFLNLKEKANKLALLLTKNPDLTTLKNNL